MDPREFTSYEKAALITSLLVGRHAKMTTAEVAQRVSLSRRGALRLLGEIARCIPLSEHNDVWRVLPSATPYPAVAQTVPAGASLPL